mmetsp:Transcript_142322/g.442519  ORF Transcript_142322/g.442519 Transcript_142322/m.442519 type:complete len:281 (-) Transcript_142322:315-1157(-)
MHMRARTHAEARMQIPTPGIPSRSTGGGVSSGRCELHVDAAEDGNRHAAADGRTNWVDSLLAKLLLVLQEWLVGAVQRVQPTQHAVVAGELLMVEVVEVGVVVQVDPRPAVAAVVELCPEHRQDGPREDTVDVRSDHCRAEREGYDVGDEHLNGVAIGGDEADGRGEFVVLLVDPGVEVHATDLAVQRPMRVEEYQLVKYDEEDGLEEDPAARRQLSRELQFHGRVQAQQAETKSVGDDHEDLADEDVLANHVHLPLVEPLVPLDLELLQHVRADKPVQE